MLANNMHPATALRSCLSDKDGKTVPPEYVASVCIRRHGGIYTGGQTVGRYPVPSNWTISNTKEFLHAIFDFGMANENKMWLDGYRSNGVHPLTHYGASWQHAIQDWPKVGAV